MTGHDNRNIRNPRISLRVHIAQLQDIKTVCLNFVSNIQKVLAFNSITTNICNINAISVRTEKDIASKWESTHQNGFLVT